MLRAACLYTLAATLCALSLYAPNRRRRQPFVVITDKFSHSPSAPKAKKKPIATQSHSSAKPSVPSVPSVPIARYTMEPLVAVNQTFRPPNASVPEKLIVLAGAFDRGRRYHNRILPLCSAQCRIYCAKDSIPDDVLASAAAVVLSSVFPAVKIPSHKPPGQRWLFTFLIEAQCLAGSRTRRAGGATEMLDSYIDWTVTYNPRSDFFSPYFRVVERSSLGLRPGELGFNEGLWASRDPNAPEEPREDWAAGKTILLAWMVSNCLSERMRLWNSLAARLPRGRVVRYGRCPGHAPNPCPTQEAACWRGVWAKVKFYYAAENSRCEGYITEKFLRPLWHGMVPLALGGLGRADYERLAPKDSFLHVDDFRSVGELAQRLLEIDRDDSQYNRFMDWRSRSKEIMIRPEMEYCDLCKQLHLPEASQMPRRRFGKLSPWFYNNACQQNSANFGRTPVRSCGT